MFMTRAAVVVANWPGWLRIAQYAAFLSLAADMYHNPGNKGSGA
jgi:hypothetical protein